jgi:hypothetical protein
MPFAQKRPGMALQNLHPRFKSGRRLQISFKQIARSRFRRRRNGGAGPGPYSSGRASARFSGAADALERLHDPVFGVAAGTIGWLALVSLISWFREWLEED